MRSSNLTRKFLARFILLTTLHVTLAHAGFLDFYQDVKPEDQPVDVNYEEMARYVEAQRQGRLVEGSSRSRIVPNIPWQYNQYLDYRRQRENKILESLLENPRILDVLESRGSSDGDDGSRKRYYEVADDSSSFNEQFPGDEVRDVPQYPRNDKFDDARENLNFPSRIDPRNNYLPRGFDDADQLIRLEDKLMNIRENPDDQGSSSTSNLDEPEFTFKFDKPKNNQHETFAISPNDPRYYEDDPTTQHNLLQDTKINAIPDDIVLASSLDEQQQSSIEKTENDPEHTTKVADNDKFSLINVPGPESHRRVYTDSVIVSSSPIMNNDIYFIAVVAGCSAAAMFALVLISLTWCRLQRGAKAAADIEYPAYGVTGPNKDISPSGDQRLAHSAQMYHFQHQKQQIIAMENRTAASRDPGSVSEADSDEENEEGDYTVYECPGLASTGEMEVKNPLFHDDPTPATPQQQIHKDGEDM